ncbi:unnamed protein product [Cylicostephanus goldi]|uniref:Uncharacterized protein n=1 Tax=Cylicostephanus goldi TaxID=71465 RepID=A0A3P6QG94_CYLGO|nr:unnamed protein product [Cylicostephanus goldi]
MKSALCEDVEITFEGNPMETASYVYVGRSTGEEDSLSRLRVSKKNIAQYTDPELRADFSDPTALLTLCYAADTWGAL